MTKFAFLVWIVAGLIADLGLSLMGWLLGLPGWALPMVLTFVVVFFASTYADAWPGLPRDAKDKRRRRVRQRIEDLEAAMDSIDREIRHLEQEETPNPKAEGFSIWSELRSHGIL